MACFQHHKHFSLLGVLEAVLHALLISFLAIWIGFALDRRFCENTLIHDAAGTTVVSVIKCSSDTIDRRSYTAMEGFFGLLFSCIALSIAVNWGRPYNIYAVGRPIKHCKNCACEEHVMPEEGRRLNAGY